MFAKSYWLLQPCIESLFLALFHTFRGTLTPVVIQLIAEHHGFVDPYNLPAILAKDAVYNAVGLAAFDLFDEVPTTYLNGAKEIFAVLTNCC